MISCEEAAHICNKKQYKEASWKERIQLFMHLVVCKTCSAFSRKNTNLTTLCDKAEMPSLTAQEKLEMKKRLRDQV